MKNMRCSMPQWSAGILLVAACLCVHTTQASEEWARFRGPNGSGTIETRGLPEKLSPEQTAWSVTMNRGWSSPVVWKDKIILTAEIGDHERAVLCLSTVDGRTLWTHSVQYEPHTQHKFNAFASSTPFVDADRIYVNWTNGDRIEALALDHQGKLIWRRDDLSAYVHEHGSGCSAVVVDGVMVVRAEFEGPDNCVLGLDAATGKTLWTLPLETSKNPYSTPVVRKTINGHEIIIADTTNGFLGIDVQKGTLNWQHNPGYTQRSVGSFAMNGEYLFGTMGSGAGGKESALLRFTGDKPSEPYQLTMGIPYVPTPLMIGDRMYLLGDGGILKCVVLQDGAELYNERLKGEAGNSTKYFSSPVSGDGKIYCCSMTGDVVIVKVSDQFEVLSSTKLDSPMYATPALAQGRIYIRTEKKLWAFQAGASPVP